MYDDNLDGFFFLFCRKLSNNPLAHLELENTYSFFFYPFLFLYFF